MTFEKVLQVFHNYLEEDPMYEIVTTNHGYALMEWGEKQEDWSNCWHLPTPEMMLDKLLDAYEAFLMWETLRDADHDELTDDEQSQINSCCDALREKCMKN